MHALPITFAECEAIYSRIEGLRTVLFTSAVPGEGSSTIAYAVAQRAAASNRRVLLIDFNTHRSYPRDTLGIPSSSWSLGQDIPPEAVCRPGGTSGKSPHILPAPIERAFSVDARQPSHVSQTLTKLQEDYDLLIGDGPSLNRLNGSGIGSIALATVFDGVVLTAAASETASTEIKRAVDRLVETDAALVGCVLNDRANPDLQSELMRQFSKYGRLGRALQRYIAPLISSALIPQERF